MLDDNKQYLLQDLWSTDPGIETIEEYCNISQTWDISHNTTLDNTTQHYKNTL